jgi:glycosyltransferase involved in cell wall biosynthesis
MSTRKTTLFYFTASYPFGYGEAFVHGEIEEAVKHFDEVVIFPMFPKGEQRPLPKNAKVLNVAMPSQLGPILLTNAFSVRSKMRTEKANFTDAQAFKKQRREMLNMLLQAFHYAGSIRKEVDQRAGADITFYSFWMNNWAMALTLLKEQKMIDAFTCRVNGYDVFDFRRPSNHIPFKAQVLAQVDTLLTTSAFTRNYVAEQFPAFEQKIKVNYLGTKNQGDNPWNTTEEFVIVSCGWINNVKRVDLIAEAVALLPFPVKWIHIGDGNERPKVEAVVTNFPANATAELKGNLSMDEINTLYRDETINLFIHASSTEGGAPMVLQEAASFGIPLMGAANGGIPEVITTQTGVLLEADPTPADMANAIAAFKNGEQNSPEFRTQVKGFWNDNFELERCKGRWVGFIG